MAIGTAAALLGSAAIGLGGSILSGKSQSKAIRTGMESQERIADKSLGQQNRYADVQREDFKPWRDVGEKALEKITWGIENGKFDPAKFNDPDYAVKWNEPEFNVKYEAPEFTAQFEAPEFTDSYNAAVRGDVDPLSDPSYQFRKQQGIDARDASAGGKGVLQSGAQMKAIEEYGQEFASNEYARAYGRVEDKYQSDVRAEDKRYGRSMDTYGRELTAARDEFGREIDQYGREVDTAQNKYAMDLNKYSMDYGRSVDQYGREITERDRTRDIAKEGYYRDLDEKNRELSNLYTLSSGGRAAAAGQAGATAGQAGRTANIYSDLGRTQMIGNQNIGTAKANMYSGAASTVNQAAENWLTYKGTK